MVIFARSSSENRHFSGWFLIFQIDLFMCNIQISTDDDSFTSSSLFQKGKKIFFPLHAVRKSCQFVLGIRSVTGNQIKSVVFQCDDTPLMVMLRDADAIRDREWFVFCKNGSAGIAFFFGVIPELMVAGEIKGNLPFLSNFVSWTQKKSASTSLKKSKNPFCMQARSPFTFQEINFIVLSILFLRQ